MAKILLVEDDDLIASTVSQMLNRENFTVEAVADGLEAMERLLALDYDLVILDWNLPSMPGIDILTRMRKAGKSTPVLMFTANSNVVNKVEGFESGADDYLAKPFEMLELKARVRALLRRPAQYVGEELAAGNVTLQVAAFRCFRDREEIKLQPKEFELLEFFLRNKGRIFSIDELLERLWSCDSDSSTDAVRKCITRLRSKIDEPGKPSLLQTVIGRGYKVDA